MPLVKSIINGQLQSEINVEDRALHYGDGLFETMLFHQGVIALWPQHLSRLQLGCAALGLKIDEKQLLKDLKNLTSDLKADSYIIKLIVSRGAAGRGLISDKSIPSSCLFLAYDFDVSSIKNNAEKKLKTCETRLIVNATLGGIKHLNRLVYVLASQELDQTFAEGIMLNDQSEMIECMMHNLFFVKDDILYTAPIQNCGVAGIKRQQVLDKAKTLGIKTNVQAIPLSDLQLMDECFITNAIVGVQSVASIDHVTFSNNAMTLQLQKNINIL